LSEAAIKCSLQLMCISPHLQIVAPNKDAAAKAIEMVDMVCQLPEKGRIFE